MVVWYISAYVHLIHLNLCWSDTSQPMLASYISAYGGWYISTYDGLVSLWWHGTSQLLVAWYVYAYGGQIHLSLRWLDTSQL